MRRRHRGITHVAGGELCGLDLQCFLVNRDVELAPNPPFQGAVLARVPPLTLNLDASAIDRQVQ